LGGKSGTQLRVTEADCGFKTKNAEVAILEDVVRSPEGNLILFVQKFLEMSDDYYDFPCQSSLLGIVVSSLGRARSSLEQAQLAATGVDRVGSGVLGVVFERAVARQFRFQGASCHLVLCGC